MIDYEDETFADDYRALLDDVVNLLLTHGWCQREWHVKNGPMCLNYALCVAGDHYPQPVRNLARWHLEAATGGDAKARGVSEKTSLLPVWNDAEGRSLYDVLAAIEAAMI